MAVLNLGYAEGDYDTITEQQKSEIYPHFLECLRGDEHCILDFGCGPGRFTKDLAGMVGGRAIGVDPIESLLRMAPQGDLVEYKVMKEGEIPLENGHVDVVWSCLVLGVLHDAKAFERSTKEIARVLRTGGLLFLVDNTSNRPNRGAYLARTPREYQAAFPSVTLHRLHDYFELGERVSILTGRKS
jgi:SAM-dependent methyltransferase